MRILVLSPHTDDEVVGCGGFIHNRAKTGHEVRVVAFSWLFSGENLKEEFIAAGAHLGVDRQDFLNFTPRFFHTQRQEIRDAMIQLREQYDSQEDWIFVPQQNDPHQDHQVITEEAIRIFGKFTLMGYECPGKSRRPVFDCVARLDEDDIQAKIDAFTQFASQKDRFYYINRHDFFRGRAADRGALIDAHFAETFEIIRMTL